MNLSDTTIGIVIGSSFTVLGVIVQGSISWFLNWRTHKMTLREQCEKETRAQTLELLHKREAAYHGFVDIMGLYLMLAGAVCKNGGCFLPENMAKGNTLQEMSKVLASIHLNGSPIIIEKVNRYMKGFSNSQQSPTLTADDIAKQELALQDLAIEMKDDLAQARCKGIIR